jgi:hypothetical protein
MREASRWLLALGLGALPRDAQIMAKYYVKFWREHVKGLAPQ